MNNFSRVEVEYLCGCKEMMGCERGRETETVNHCIKVLCRVHQWSTPTPHLLILTRASPAQQTEYEKDLQAAKLAFKKPVNEGAPLVGADIDSHCRHCKKTTSHVIHAVHEGKPHRVECFTCHSVHKFYEPKDKV